ncbi:pyrophosphatase PpaX [Proteiniclasticum sp. C24MP]|uniref:pyrophosphatase PpaX n=1 Tax=Proteiniclasticum sp. C24MP TaxID=3374101 RepID=UPI003754337D
MIEAVLFDLDGTVANTNELIYESFRRLFYDKMKLEVPDEEIYSLFGEPLENSLKKYTKSPQELLPFFREFNESNHDRMIRSFEGVEEALIMLKEKGLKLGIVTSKRAGMARRSLEALGLTDYFEVLITPESTDKHKPEPEPLYKACELLGGIDPKNTIMVGDASYDILCGNRAGATSVAVSYSMIHPDTIKRAQPHYMVDDLRELVDLVHKLNEERS